MSHFLIILVSLLKIHGFNLSIQTNEVKTFYLGGTKNKKKLGKYHYRQETTSRAKDCLSETVSQRKKLYF